MLIISYDITNDKLRTKFSRYLKKYGRRLQFSVYEIENSERILKNIMAEIRNDFEKKFTKADSVIIFDLNHKEIHRFGYAINEESDLVIFE
ncbi:MAG: CRISPR-associated endonuclease Cas2 [Spirochaetia bacterium]|nr:CRISPR-associated endonuclease Cas2 [Spirochaetia bacterium]